MGQGWGRLILMEGTGRFCMLSIAGLYIGVGVVV